MVLQLIIFSFVSGCARTSPGEARGGLESLGARPGVIAVTGDGIDKEKSFTIEEIKGMDDALAGACYSSVNLWPTIKFYTGKGIYLWSLLQKTGIKKEAQTITVWGSDGYSTVFTREQLEEKRYYYPNILKGNREGAQEVPPILAWEYSEGTGISEGAEGGEICLFFGQKGLNDATAAAFVKKVAAIEVSTRPPGRWDAVGAEPLPGRVSRGTGVLLKHLDEDRVKIYYTLDGSTPDENSLLYNPSTSYFRPQLTKPILVEQDVVIKAVAEGFGKYRSPVAVFAYSTD